MHISEFLALRLGMNVYVGDPPDFDADDNEIFPEFVFAFELEVGYMSDHFQDVVDLVYKQKPTAATDDVIECLNHYDKFDDFLDWAGRVQTAVHENLAAACM